jgi:hypothetical protein
VINACNCISSPAAIYFEVAFGAIINIYGTFTINIFNETETDYYLVFFYDVSLSSIEIGGTFMVHAQNVNVYGFSSIDFHSGNINIDGMFVIISNLVVAAV